MAEGLPSLIKIYPNCRLLLSSWKRTPKDTRHIRISGRLFTVTGLISGQHVIFRVVGIQSSVSPGSSAQQVLNHDCVVTMSLHDPF